MVTKTAPKTAS